MKKNIFWQKKQKFQGLFSLDYAKLILKTKYEKFKYFSYFEQTQGGED